MLDRARSQISGVARELKIGDIKDSRTAELLSPVHPHGGGELLAPSNVNHLLATSALRNDN